MPFNRDKFDAFTSQGQDAVALADPPTPQPTQSNEQKLAEGRKGFNRERFESFQREQANQQASIEPEPEPERFPLGSVAGSIAASALTGPSGLAAGAVRAGIGAVLGEFAQQGVEFATDSEFTPESLDASMKQAGKEFLFGAGGEVVGVGLIRGGQALLRPLSGKLKPGATEAVQELKKFDPKLELTPSEATDFRLIDALQNLAEGGVFGEDVFNAFRRNRDVALNQMTDVLVEYFGKKSSPDEVGDLLVNIFENNLKMNRAVAEPMWNKVTELTRARTVTSEVIDGTGVAKQVTEEIPELKISIKDLQDFARRELKKVEPLKGFEPALGGDKLLNDVLSFDESLPYETAKIARTRLRAKREALEAGIETRKDPSIGVVKQLEKRMDQAMREGLKENPEALEIWLEANKIYRSASARFNNRTIRKLKDLGLADRKGTPEKVVDAIFRPNNVTAIKRARLALGEDSWSKAQAGFIQRVLEKTPRSKIPDESTVVEGTKFLENLNALGDKALNIAFDPSQLANLRKFGRTVQLAQSQAASKTFSFAVKLTQFGAFAVIANDIADEGLGTLIQPDSAKTILIAPPILGRLLTRGPAVRWLTEGLLLNKNSPRWRQLSKNLAKEILKQSPKAALSAAPRELPSSQPSVRNQPLVGTPQLTQ